ncbi:chemiosmotic efflux system C protein A (plasmid) [Legionella adelaidensis]|uniref:Chemiosmotic efflux system C protein A n=1 Tax=Legionella adelaidensis TaxID=45056 RepID=A0A0W0R5V5_9GAMM|nr:hypothetical protein [Legionella adelaidensis]KTC66396.1 chemiosmotic efflux system C protein A [Legionella adelaidensis]VEH84994.1 chemiosmotic efflux system C protein A [Legionella adelaidensis]
MKRMPFTTYYPILLSFIISLFILATPLELFANTTESPKLETPTSIPALWKEIDTQAASIDQAIQENKLTSIHEHAFAIRDLVNALPALSKDLSDEQKQTLQDNLSYVDALATRLDKAGDAGDKEGTKSNWGKLQKILEQLRGIFSLNPQM